MLNERAKREQLFFLYSLKASNNKVAKLHVFECDLVQPCGRCCAARISSMFRFKPYNLHRMSTASCWMSATKENMLCFCIYWNRTKRKWRNCMFFFASGGGGGAPQEVLRLKKSACMCSRRLVEEPSPSTVWLQQLGCFFFSRKEKFHCAHAKAPE